MGENDSIKKNIARDAEGRKTILGSDFRWKAVYGLHVDGGAMILKNAAGKKNWKSEERPSLKKDSNSKNRMRGGARGKGGFSEGEGHSS